MQTALWNVITAVTRNRSCGTESTHTHEVKPMCIYLLLINNLMSAIDCWSKLHYLAITITSPRSNVTPTCQDEPHKLPPVEHNLTRSHGTCLLIHKHQFGQPNFQALSTHAWELSTMYNDLIPNLSPQLPDSDGCCGSQHFTERRLTKTGVNNTVDSQRQALTIL